MTCSGTLVRTGNRIEIRVWTALNTVTACFAALFFALAAGVVMFFFNDRRMELSPYQASICEAVAFVPVLLASVVDLGGLIYEATSIENWLGESIPHRLKPLRGPSASDSQGND